MLHLCYFYFIENVLADIQECAHNFVASFFIFF